MIGAMIQNTTRAAIARCVRTDRGTLERLREEVRSLRNVTQKMTPYSTAAMSLVATDGGNNQFRCDPFFIQIIRVVNSSGDIYCLDAVSSATSVAEMSAKQFHAQGAPCTALGYMMSFLGVTRLTQLSPHLTPPARGLPFSPEWIQAYRELVEWAALFALLEDDFGTDTVVVHDGLLRSRAFASDLFQKLLWGMHDRMMKQWRRYRRRIYIVGVAKHSEVLNQYRLAMKIEGVLQNDFPAYVAIPQDMEKRAYVRLHFPQNTEEDGLLGTGTFTASVGGRMFLAKFGSKAGDAIWPVDLFATQKESAPEVLGALLSDATNGFPVLYYPQCLQKAHERAALDGFEMDILRGDIRRDIRNNLGVDALLFEQFQLQDADPARLRYG